MNLWSMLRCPRCHAAVRRANASARCSGCSHSWPLLDGAIPYFALDRVDEDSALRAEIDAQRLALSAYVDMQTLSFHWDRRRMQEEAALLGVESGIVLDVGCGPGFLGRLLSGVEVVGVDVSPELLRTARSSCARLVGAPAEQLPFADESVDGVFARGVLHHTLDPKAALGEMHRVLRAGGRAVFSDPRAFAPVERLKSVLRRRNPKYARTHKAFGRSQYTSMIAGAGFEIEVVWDADPVALPWIVLADEMRIGQQFSAPALTRRLLAAEAALEPLLRRLPALRRFGFTVGVRARKPVKSQPVTRSFRQDAPRRARMYREAG